VLAGWGSAALLPAGPRVDAIGPVGRVEDFYADVDCVVAPVDGGSGMKCKLAEAALSGRPVITTELGARGYPPPIRRHFTLREPAGIDAAAIDRAISSFDAGAARTEIEREMGWGSVVGRYARVFAEAPFGSGEPATT
jgi:hypothetical protein